MSETEAAKPPASGRRIRWIVGLSLLGTLVVLAALVLTTKHDPYVPPQDPLSAGLSPADAPGGEPLTVTEHGFEVFTADRVLSYGFVLANASGLLAQETRVDVHAVGADGVRIPEVSWTAIVKRVPGGASVGHAGSMRTGGADVVGLDIEVRDTQAWWTDDGSVGAELAVNASGPEFGATVDDGERVVEFTLSKTGVAQYRADLNLLFRNSSGAVVGGCARTAEVEKPSEDIAVLCRIPGDADPAATGVYADAHWTVPLLPYPYPPES